MDEGSNIEKITSKILEDADKRSKEIIDEAKREGEERRDAAKRKGESAKKKIFEGAEKTAEQTKKKLVAEAVIKARTAILESKEKLIRESFENAKIELEKLPASNSYPQILYNIVRDTCIKMGGGDLELIIRKEDEKILKKDLKKLEDGTKKATGVKTNLKMSAEGRDAGVIVKGGNGNIQIDSTFNNRIDLFRHVLRLQVAEVLFK